MATNMTGLPRAIGALATEWEECARSRAAGEPRAQLRERCLQPARCHRDDKLSRLLNWPSERCDAQEVVANSSNHKSLNVHDILNPSPKLPTAPHTGSQFLTETLRSLGPAHQQLAPRYPPPHRRARSGDPAVDGYLEPRPTIVRQRCADKIPKDRLAYLSSVSMTRDISARPGRRRHV